MKGVVTVLERQLAEYLTGDLSTPTPVMLEQTKSAPIHNIYSERILGMTDHQFHRAPNATTGFIDAKVKAAQNKTLQWLSSKECNTQEHLIKFSIKRAREVRVIRKKREDLKTKVCLERQQIRKQKKDQTSRNKLEKKIKAVVASGVIDEGLQNELDLSVEKQQTFISIIEDNKSIEGHYIEHFWFVSSVNTLYHGRILEVKKPKSGPYKVIVSYWLDAETEEDSEDHKIPLSQLLTDFVLGDLIFL